MAIRRERIEGRSVIVISTIRWTTGEEARNFDNLTDEQAIKVIRSH